MAVVPSRNVHRDIQKRIDQFNDLESLELHSAWGTNPAQFVENRMVGQRVMDTPDYYFSPSTQMLPGFWKFNIDMAVEETTLFTLLDDVTAEMAAMLIMIRSTSEPYIGFTVNLNVLRCNASPSAKLFYFEGRPTHISDRKAVIECPLFDAETGEKLLAVRATIAFLPASVVIKGAATSTAKTPLVGESTAASLLPSLDAADSKPLSEADLYELSQVMNFLPHGTALHSAGLQSLTKRRLVATFDFSEDLSGPPIYVHGGLLGTVLYNASAMIVAKVLGVDSKRLTASIRDIDYKKGFPLACKDIVVDATVESVDTESGKVFVLAKLVRRSSIYTTLRTTFELPKLPSRL